MKNMKLYQELRKNGREKLTMLSRTLHMPVSSIFERIRRSSVLKRFTVLLNYQEMGYSCLTHTIIKVEKAHKDALRSFLKNHPNTNTLLRINNGYDFIVEGVFENMQEAEKFLESLDEFNIIEEKTHYVLEEIERESFLTK
jgi:DNA-binding Lrp family transcriptional regulator